MATAAEFRRRIQLAVANDLTPEAMGKRLASYARRDRDAHIARGQAPPVYSTIVGGVVGAVEETVKPGQAIIYQFQRLGQAGGWAMERVLEMSPKKRTPPPMVTRTVRPLWEDFYADQWVYALGERQEVGKRKKRLAKRYKINRIIRPDSFNPLAVTPDIGELLLFNRSPYARKVQTKLIGGKALKFSNEAWFLEDVAREGNAKFRGLDFSTVYTVTFPNQYTRRRGKDAGRLTENPALVISTR